LILPVKKIDVCAGEWVHIHSGSTKEERDMRCCRERARVLWRTNLSVCRAGAIAGPLLAVAAVCVSCSGPPDPAKEAAKLAAQASKMMMAEEYAGAREKLLLASAKRPDCVEYHVGIAGCSVRLNELETAAEHYAVAEKILAVQAEKEPDRVDDYLMVLVCQNKEKQAAEELAKARTRFANDQNVQRMSEAFPEFVKSWSTFRIETQRNRNKK
jgi:hypothetical protein